MKNLVFDSSVILDVWLKRSDENQQRITAALLSDAANGHHHAWISSSSLLMIDSIARAEFIHSGLSATEASNSVQQCMTDLLKQVRILSNFSFHMTENLLAGNSLELGLLALAAAELQGETALVTTNGNASSPTQLPQLTPDAAKVWLQEINASKVSDFIDLKTQQDHIRPLLERNIHRVLKHGQYVMGSEITDLETKMADFIGVKHCVSNASGTDALLIAMMALGIKAGDEVITTPFTFIATGEMIVLLGAKPVFVDIDAQTYNIDPAKIEAAITAKTKAIMPVSLYGQCADFDAINAIAAKYNLPVIEDGAQSFGATYHGKQSCGLSTIGCTSFFPSKPLGAYGDGGACFTNDDALAKIMREIRLHGQDRRYHHPRIGINGRLDTLQAAVLLAKWDLFNQEIGARADVGRTYSALITTKNAVLAQNTPSIIPPFIATGNTSVYAQYTLLVNDRDALQEKLNTAGLPTAVHYPVPLHKQPALATEEFALPIAEALSEKVISLPMHPYLSTREQEQIIAVLYRCL